MAGHHKLVGKVAEDALKMLSNVGSVFNQNKVDYCLEGGTLLGIVRENRLLPWDDDMDLTITEHQIPNLKQALKALPKKYRVRKRYYFTNYKAIKEGNLRLIRISNRKWFFFKGKVRMDIFVKYSDQENYYWTVGGKNNFVIKSIPKRFYDKTEAYEFNKQKYLVPQNYTQYLTLRYGDWQKPVKEWDCLNDDNAKIN
ncbi:LicD family protein [Catenovulum adriaticum]|uniref:LicD family protein n=1 Tax=Catenovulum adriaticum TaxID=2984846 RepID=A0ABY7AK82_9ALTE|nr:LicD family protein [Catenovulum sp. TS8]WAJ69677.1 LicD family protein [Catenovulum sp. TS8]